MLIDKTYAGSPAKDVTERIGSQFEDKPLEDKYKLLEEYLMSFTNRYNLGSYSKYVRILKTETQKFNNDSLIQINVEKRMYKKTGSILEHYLIRFLLPDIKLIPSD